MTYLIGQVQKSLQKMLVEAVGTEYLITADFLFRQGNERLYDPETMLIHMYANNCVPDETGFFATDILGEYLEKKLKKLEYQLEHLTEDAPTAASVSPKELLEFRCKVARDQLAMIEAVDRENVMQDSGEVQPEDLCVKGKTIESKFPPQWYRLPELVGQIEQMHRVERALKRQLDALNDEEAACRERGELALWQLRCQLRAEQLDQIQEGIALTESLVPTMWLNVLFQTLIPKLTVIPVCIN